MKQAVSITVNGTARENEVEPRLLLVHYLRETLGLTGTHVGCDTSQCGGGTVLIDSDFDAGRTLATVARERVTACMTVPTMLTRLLAVPGLERYDRSSLRCVISTGAPLPPSVRLAVLDRLTPSFYQFYSSTESGGITVLPPWRQHDRGDSVGTGVFGKELRLEDDGEVLSRGPAVMAEYAGNPEATAAAIDADGWLHTGDVGVLDDAGNLKITDRLKDMYISGGFNVYPAEVEQTLLRAEGVQDVAVIGVPDERMGEVGKAFVVGTATADELLAFAKERLANFKIPRYFESIDVLPRNLSGKVLKNELRSR